MKKLLVIAVAAGLIAPAAMADTTLYGKLHASVGSVKVSPAGGSSTTNTVVESHASRIGIKGSTALDNGLEATYGVEYGLDIDGDNTPATTLNIGTGTITDPTHADSNSLVARNTFVGVKGGFGEVRVGRHDTPAKLATAGLDNFADTYADLGNVTLVDNLRVDNAVAYINKFGPVGVAVAHSTATGGVSLAGIKLTGGAVSEGDTAGNRTDANDFMVNYSNGPWYAALGHTALQDSLKNTNVGVQYKTEAGHQAALVHEQTKYDGGDKEKATYVTGTYKLGNVALKAGYGERKADGVDGKLKQTTLGADYSLGKKTSVYLLLNEQKDNVGGGTADKVAQTAVGVVTEF